jgi:hypothetical protein
MFLLEHLNKQNLTFSQLRALILGN